MKNKAVAMTSVILSGAALLLPHSLFALNQKDLATLRDTRQCIGCDLSYAELRQADLAGVNLSWANLRGANLSGARLAGALLERSTLDGADLRGADLSGANLFKVNAVGSNFSGAQMMEANLIEARLVNADLSWCNLRGAILKNAALDGANLAGIDLAGANLAGVDLPAAVLDKSRQRTADTVPAVSGLAAKARQTDKKAAAASQAPERIAIPMAGGGYSPAGSKAEEPGPQPPPSQPPAATVDVLKGIQSSSVDNEFNLMILTDNFPQSKAFYLKEPPRLVIDLFGRWKKKGFPVQLVKNNTVDNIRVGRYPDKLRLTLNLKDDVPKVTQVKKFAGGLILSVTGMTGKGQNPSANAGVITYVEAQETEVPVAQAAARPPQDVRAAPAVVAARTESPEQPAVSQSSPGKDGRQVRSVRSLYQDNVFRLEMELDSPVQQMRPFVLKNPDRVFLDLPGRWRIPTPPPTVPENPLVERLRLGSAPESLRVVLDMKTARFQSPLVSVDGARLALVLEPGAGVAVDAPKKKAATAGPPPAPVETATAASGPVRPLYEIRETVSGGALSLELVSDGPIAKVKTFSLKNPSRQVLDIPGNWRRVGADPGDSTADSPASKIRVSRHPDKLRIVCDMKIPPPFAAEVQETPKGLIFTLRP